jgi:hypothetical protein
VRWRKLGHVFVAQGDQDWARTGAMLPTTILLGEDRIRVFAALSDGDRVGRLGYVDVDARDPRRVLGISTTPALDIGEPGTFDDNGVSPLSICHVDDRLYLYYAGWQLGVHVRYFLFTGLAISSDGGSTFARHSRVPVLDRSDAEPLVRTGGYVLHNDSTWSMWYAGGERWTHAGDRARPTYDMRHIESSDGINWPEAGEVCLRPTAEDEFGFGRPFVVDQGDLLRMWYSIRTISKGYRIGYAESPDGRKWSRQDDRAGIDVSEQGWDSEMICFPWIQATSYGTYLFYNGNNYGATGFGVAVAEGD